MAAAAARVFALPQHVVEAASTLSASKQPRILNRNKLSLLYRDAAARLPAGLLSRVTSGRADIEAAGRVHTSRWLAKVLHGDLSRDEERRLGFPWSPTLPQRAIGSVAATLAAVRYAVRHGSVAGSLCGGSHHAFADVGAGFCSVNDIAVAAVYALEHLGVQPPILLIDLDVHQGNGTNEMMAHEPRVVTFDMYALRNYPLRKQASDWDVALADNTGDAEYTAALDAWLTSLMQGLSPGLVLVQAGVDPLQQDRLGRLALTRQGLALRNDIVLRHCRGIPTVFTLGGGYCDPIDVSNACHLDVYQQAVDAAPSWHDVQSFHASSARR